ncbi:MAG: hypothetical protein ACK4MR_08100, partial [Erythrobacter cryptus]
DAEWPYRRNSRRRQWQRHDVPRSREMSEKLPAMHADPSRIRYLTLALQLEEGHPPRLIQLTVWLVAAIVACAGRLRRAGSMRR